jgi:predicted transcriptional regulator of viral defense system
MPRTRPDGRSPDWSQLYEQAAPQAGYFQLAQARAVGYSPPLLEYYVGEGRVERVARGVFRLVHYPPSDHEDLVVAWLWSDRVGVFSHETALALHELSDALPARKHMTVPTASIRRRLRLPAGVTLHFGDLEGRDRTWKGPIPVTSPLRTLVDCTTGSSPPELVHQAADQGVRRGLFTRTDLRRELSAARSQTAPGRRSKR